jgi:hypothetical protein
MMDLQEGNLPFADVSCEKEKKKKMTVERFLD